MGDQTMMGGTMQESEVFRLIKTVVLATYTKDAMRRGNASIAELGTSLGGICEAPELQPMISLSYSLNESVMKIFLLDLITQGIADTRQEARQIFQWLMDTVIKATRRDRKPEAECLADRWALVSPLYTRAVNKEEPQISALLHKMAEEAGLQRSPFTRIRGFRKTLDGWNEARSNLDILVWDITTSNILIEVADKRVSDNIVAATVIVQYLSTEYLNLLSLLRYARDRQFPNVRQF